MIKGGADVNKTTIGDQSSPLLVAVINGNYDLAKELLEADADPNILSDDGAGPLFATLNIEWSLRTWYPQPQAFRQQKTDYLELMEHLLLAGADPDQRVSTHIWYAAYNAGRMGVDFSGATPFWRASYAHDVEAMKLLVAHGADPNIWTYNIIDPRRRFFLGNNQPEDEEDPSGLPPVEHGGLGVHPLHAATGVGFGSSRVAQQHRGVPDGWLPAAKYLIEELGFTPEQIREIVHEIQKDLGKPLMMIDEALLEKRQFAEGDFEAFLPCKVQFELELESNYLSTVLSNFAVNQLIYQLN